MHHRARDLTGLNAGYLTALRYHGSNGKKSIWTLQCTCGREIQMDASEFMKQVKSGRMASCGCMKSATQAAQRITHGMSRHPAYAVWRSMKARCTNPSH